ncbi:NlpC/P60 family protein [Carnobacterium gallinarum]|uniref:C40 family peptidase n=1 Tax=Carnobacterium gallinarum TaxID=2749 RepID=UPI00054CDEC1|nr:NlpC/P60 family protein [Carnobacterium gallinarum]
MQKKITKVVLIGVVSTSLLNFPISVFADDYDSKISNQESKINQVANQEQMAASDLKSLQIEMKAIEDKSVELATTQKELTEKKTTLVQNIDELSERIQQREGEINKQARAAQVHGDPANYLRVIIEATSVSEVLGRINAVWTLISANSTVLKVQEQDKKLLVAHQTEIDTTMKNLDATILASETKKSQLESKQLQQTVLQSELAVQRATEESQKNKFMNEKEIAQQKQAENQRLAQEIAERKASEEAAAKAVDIKEPALAAVPVSANTHVDPEPAQVEEPVAPPSATNPVEPTPPAPSPTPPPAVSFSVAALLSEAQKWKGTPYSWGGGNVNGPSLGFGEGAGIVGFDCSSFVQYVYARVGVSLSRVTYQQEYQGTYLNLNQIQPGDLIFWGSRGLTHHVGIYMGNNQYIHAPETGDVVKVSNLSPYYGPSFGVRVRG